MDRLVRLFYGGIVSQNGEFEHMEEKALVFPQPPSYAELASSVSTDVSFFFGRGLPFLRGRYDSGRSRAHYGFLDITSESDWVLYKEVVKDSNVRCFEVVASERATDGKGKGKFIQKSVTKDRSESPPQACNEYRGYEDEEGYLTQGAGASNRIESPTPANFEYGGYEDEEGHLFQRAGASNRSESLTPANWEYSHYDDADADEEEEGEGEEEEEDGVTRDFEASQCFGMDDQLDHFDLARVTDSLDDESYRLEDDDDDGDDISLGSEDMEEGEEYESEESAEYDHDGRGEDYQESDGGDGSDEADVDAQAAGHEEDLALQRSTAGMPFYTCGTLREEDLAFLRSAGVDVPTVHHFEDLSRAHLAVSESVLPSTLDIHDASDAEIVKGQRFESLEKLQMFLMDYSVRHHRQYKVAKSNARLRYIVVCKHECGWCVRARADNKYGGWKISSVKQPHRCASNKDEPMHVQNTAKYIGRRIAGIVEADPEIKIKALRETIKTVTGYPVSYSKAWRAKQHVMQLVYGDWKESYSLLPKILSAIKHYNPGTCIFIDTCGKTVADKQGLQRPVLQRVFWCFPQCVEAFRYCRPVITVDGTFLNGKYRGVLMMANAFDPENQIVPIAFALVESENNESWNWFMDLLRRRVIHRRRSRVCLISDRHAGIMSAARRQIDGHPPLVHRWCIRHFAANFSKRQKDQDVVAHVKKLCYARTERAFERLWGDLEPVLNREAKAWMAKQMENKSRWALAFDEGGARFGIMTTNASESLNNVFKSIRALPVMGIAMFSFGKLNKYFVDRYGIAKAKYDHGDAWGAPVIAHLALQKSLSAQQIADVHGPERNIYNVRSAGGTNAGGERWGGRNYKVDIEAGTCQCNVPQTLHMPCSHLITACKIKGLKHESERFLSRYYSKGNTLMIWKPMFHPYYDPSQWPPYDGPEYFPDPDLLRVKKKGRWKKKRLRGAMDNMRRSGRGVGEGSSQNRCTICQEYGHNARAHNP